MTEPTNVFEWCWEHSRAVDEDRKLLLWLAFQDEHPNHRPSLPSIAALAHVLDLSWTQVSLALYWLNEMGELAITQDSPVSYYSFPAYETARLPHTLTLSTWTGEPYGGEDAHRWDEAEIECPHQPATETMPCAQWEPCGCPGNLAEAPLYEGGDGDGRGPCARSATGVHHYIDGEPNQPVASCFARDWEDEVAERAFELGLMPGRHLVRPWWDGDQIQLELVEPQAVAR